MILYKYVSFEAGCKILKSQTIGFSNPEYFNDPLEMSGGHGVLPQSSFAGIIFKSLIQRHAILSLTRSPLNSLMWSHYANTHSGFVIGWDAAIAGLTDENKNVVPAQLGNVIYTSTRPNHNQLGAKHPINYGEEYSLRPELFEFLQRLFLFKSMCWSYEEEVRVVKCIYNRNHKEIPSGPIEEAVINGRPMFLSSFVPEAIKEIYLGIYNPISFKGTDLDVLIPWKDIARIMECRLASDSWDIQATAFDLDNLTS